MLLSKCNVCCYAPAYEKAGAVATESITAIRVTSALNAQGTAVGLVALSTLLLCVKKNQKPADDSQYRSCDQSRSATRESQPYVAAARYEAHLG